MSVFVEYLAEAGVISKTNFSRLSQAASTAVRPMSDKMRARHHAFPHEASYASEELHLSGVSIKVLHLKKTDDAKQDAAFQLVTYLRRLNEVDALLRRRSEEGFKDANVEFAGHLAWTGDFYRLSLWSCQRASSSEALELPRIADCELHEDTNGHHRLKIAFWDPVENATLFRCTPLHKERNAPILTKSIRINMMEVRKRFLLVHEPSKTTHIATEKDAESETTVEDQLRLNQELIAATTDGDARAMALAIIKGADINAREADGRQASVLHLVALSRSSFVLDVVFYNPNAHRGMIQDLLSVGVTDIDHANQAIRSAQRQLDAAVVDSEYFFPSEYVQDVGQPKSDQDVLTRYQNHTYQTLMALEDRHLVRKGMPQGLNFGYDPEARAKFFKAPNGTALSPAPPER